VTTTSARPAGRVTFVGTGPGDPGLLTLRAAAALAHADVVVVDDATQRALLGHARPEAEIVEATDGGEPLAVAARAKLVLAAARQGSEVVRLIAGDPFGTGPAVDEVLAVAKAGVPFEVVPGVAVATGVPGHAGIPLGHARARSLTVVDPATGPAALAALAAAPVEATVVVVDPVPVLRDVVAALRDAGRTAGTPVAVTAAGTTVEQVTVVSTLGALIDDVAGAELPDPVVLVVGDAVTLREQLSWFEAKPLFGWRVLVPRTKEQAASLSAALRGYGAVPEEVPTISVEPPRNPQQMERAIRGLVEGRYEWVAFTSVNALRAVREKFEEYGLDARAFSGLKVAAVGEKTAQALAGWGIVADLVPSGEQSAAGLLADWPEYDEVLDPINRVFLPRADIATENLVAGLVELGWEVDDVTAYRTVRAAPPPAEIRDAIKSGRFDAVVFTSSSTVRNLVGIAGKPHAATVVACIGPQTARTAEEHGLRVDVLAASPSVEALTTALAEFGARRRAALLEAGDPVTRPSDKRRPAAKRTAR
jgi:uroporphyrinogen III methyltransferase/synthase